MTDVTVPIGLVLGSHMPPEGIPRTARLAEELGFGELWFSEDCFFGGAMSGITAALDATERLPVGLGIASAVTRHPALHAMELATMSRLHPGRLRAGVGLGVPAWLDQMGLRPRSPLGAMRECVSALRRLLDGGSITETGGTFVFEGVELTHKPAERIPIYLGVVNEKGLRLSGELADGTVLSVLAGTEYVRWARRVVTEAAASAGRDPAAHRIVTYALCSVDADGQKARAAVRDLVAFYLQAMPDNALSQVYGIETDVQALLGGGDVARLSTGMPDRWVDDLAVAGDPEECAARLRALLDAGSDAIGLWLFPLERSDEVATMVATEVLPRL